MDPSTRNLLVLGAVVAVIYWWCKTQKDPFTALASAPYDGPVDSTTVVDNMATSAPGVAVPGGMAGGMTGVGGTTAVPVGATSTAAPSAAAQQANAMWQTEAKAINAHADSTNYVDSRAMDGIDSTSGWTRKNSTWDVRGAVPIKRDPSASFFGQSSRMPPPPSNNTVFCPTS